MADDKVNGMIKLLSKEDQEWYWAECNRVYETLGYHLSRRNSGISALKMFLMSEKGYSASEAASLKEMDPKVLKGLLEEMFKAYADPEKTPQENLRNMGRIHKNALNKINEIPIPDVDEIKTMADMEKTAALEEGLDVMQIDFTQDLEEVKDHPSDLSFKEAYYEGAGGQMDYDRKLGKWGTFSQGVQLYRRHINNKSFSNISKAYAFDQYKKFLKTYKGKTINSIPADTAGYYSNYLANGILQKADYIKAGEDSSRPEYDAFVNGETTTFPGQEEMEKTLNDVTEDTLKTSVISYDDAMTNLTKTNMQVYTAPIPDFDNNTEDLLTLPEETQSKMLQAYYLTFGKVYDTTLLLNILQADCDTFDFIYSGDKTIRGLVGEKYKNYSPYLQEKAMMLETMRRVIKDPDGVSCSYFISGPKSFKISTPVKITNNMSSIKLRDGVDLDEAVKFSASPKLSGVMFDTGKDIKIYLDNFFSGQKATLKKHGMNKFDAIYIGNKTLNELYEEQYAGKLPGIGEVAKEILICSILAAESFDPKAPIYAAVLSEKGNGELEKSVVPITFSGKNLVLSQDRTKNIDDVKKTAEQILRDRDAIKNDPELAKTNALNRAEETITREENTPEYDMYNIRLNAIKQRVSLIDPASREFMKDTLRRMEELNKNGEVTKAHHDYKVYLRASKLTENPEMKEFFKSEAEKIRTSSPYADYESYVKGMEYSYGLYNTKDPREYPVELQSFFEKNTGRVIPGFVVSQGDMDTYANYRPIEVALSINGVQDEKKVDNLIEDIYKVAKYIPVKNEDINKFIIVGGRTLSEILQEKKGGSYRENMGEPERAEIIIDAIKAGEPVDFYVSENKRSVNPVISNIPIHVVSEGSSYNNIAPEKKQAQQAAFEKMSEGIDKKIRTEEEFTRREIRMNKDAERNYENYWKTECHDSKDKSKGSTTWAMYATYFPEGEPKVGKSLPGKLTDEEAVKLQAAIRPIRLVPVNYILSKLAAESERLKSEGKEGYSIEDMVSVNALADRKKEFAEEFKRVCAENDVETYYRSLKEGSDAMVQIVYNEEELRKAVESDAAMDEAFLGKKLAFTGAILDNKQELEQSIGTDYQVKIGLFKDGQEAQDYYKRLYDTAIIGKTVSQKKVFERMVSSGATELSGGIFEYQQYEVVKNKLAEKVPKGEDPIAGMTEILLENEGLSENNVIDAIPVLSNQLVDGNQDIADKIGNGTYLDTLDIDYEKIKQAVDDESFESAADSVKIVTAAEKDMKYQQMLADSLKIGFDKRLNETSEKRKAILAEANKSDMISESPEINKAFDELFGPVLDRPVVQNYLNQNPDKDIFDLLRVGGYSLNQWKVNSQSEASMKTFALQCIADPRIPISYVDIFYNPENGTFKMGDPRSIIEIANVERLAKERPQLRNIEGFKTYITSKNKGIDTSGYSDSDWQELYEREIQAVAEEERVPDEIITSMNELKQGTDPINPQEIAINYLETIYGAEQSFVSDWTGKDSGESAVYSKEVFMRNYQKMEKGQFSNKDFAMMALYASLDPTVTTGDVYSESSDLMVSHELKVKGASNRWTSDIRTENFQPRAAMMTNLMDITVAPARKIVEEGIAELQSGNPNKLANCLKEGIKNTLDSLKMQTSFRNPEGDCAH